MPVRSPSLSILLALFLFAAGAAPSLGVPSPPTDRADRFGVYHWSADISSWPGTPDRLAWGADFVAEIGSRTIRVYMGPDDPYRVNPAPNAPGDLYLRRIAASPAYDALFRDPRFRTYLLTVSISSDEPNGFAAVRRQIARLGEYLLAEPAYAGKTFILLNWEGDNAVGAEPPGSPEWDEFISRTQARAEGVREARSRRRGSSAQLYSGLEFNLVERDGVRCGDGKVRCVIDTVAPRVTVDYYSYSAWQSLDVKREQPAASLAKVLKDDLGFALWLIRRRRPDVGEGNFILGELGFARSLYSECQAARYVRELVLALEGPGAFRVSYAIYWQALDNGWRGGRRTPCVGDLRDAGDPEGQVDWLLHGLFRGRNAEMTLSGAVLRDLLRGQPAALPKDCPWIGPQGIFNAEEGRPLFKPGGLMTISGQAFGRRGNQVLILQAHDRQGVAPNVLLGLSGDAGDPGWQESPKQITATLPEEDLHDGCALVWVANRNGVESNARLVRIRPD